MAEDIQEVTKLVGDVNRAFDEYKKANDERLKEIEQKGKADPLLDEKLAKMDQALNAAQDRLDQFEAASKRPNVKYVDERTGEVVDLDAKAADWATQMAALRREVPPQFDAEGLSSYKAAFNRFMRKGADEAKMGPDELKALSVGSDPDGGYVVHPDMNGRIVAKVFETSPMRQVASVQVIGTDALEGLFDLNEASFGWVEETGTRAETNTPELGKWRIPVHEMYAFPKATQKLLDDASIDMEAWLSAKVADRFARAENAAFVTGDGVGKPRGFTTYDDGSTLPGTIQRHNTGANGAFAGAGAGADVFIDALYSLKAPYRANATWALNRTTEAAVRKIKDSDGAYIWVPGLATNTPSTILGRPVLNFEDMANLATGSLSVAVADWREAYQIVDRIGIRVLRDPYTAKPYVGLYATKRVGGDVVNFEAIKLIEASAS